MTNSKYQELIPSRLPQISEMLAQGVSETAIAAAVGVAPSTLRRWRKSHPELALLFEQNSALRDELVESALLKRATGYADASGKEIPPDVRAAVFWLQSRRPKQWAGAANTRKKKKSGKVEILLEPEERDL